VNPLGIQDISVSARDFEESADVGVGSDVFGINEPIKDKTATMVKKEAHPIRHPLRVCGKTA
jgi:hypothetical protein